MAEREERQAKIFVDTAAVDLLADTLATRLDRPREGLPESSTIVTPVLDLWIERNDDRARGHVDPADAFLFFPCLVWAHAEEEQASPAVVDAVAEVLGILDELGLDYVTASDFEHDLPNAGRST